MAKKQRAQASFDYLVSMAASFGAFALLLPAVFFAYSLSQKSSDTVNAADFIETTAFVAKSASSLGPRAIVSRQAQLSQDANLSRQGNNLVLGIGNRSFSREVPRVFLQPTGLSAGNYLVKAQNADGTIFFSFTRLN